MTELQGHVPGKYTVLSCPLPTGITGKCGSDLYYEWKLSGPAVYLGDLTGGAAPSTEDAWSGTWSVACEEGHTILVPAELKGCADDCTDCPGHDEDPDEAMRTVRASDLDRLREVLLALGPVVDLSGIPQIVDGPPAVSGGQPRPCPAHTLVGTQLNCGDCGTLRRRHYEREAQ